MVSTHDPPQICRGAAQMGRHAPAEHSWFIGHAIPQPPQLPTSVCVLTQEPPQRTKPMGQATSSTTSGCDMPSGTTTSGRETMSAIAPPSSLSPACGSAQAAEPIAIIAETT